LRLGARIVEGPSFPQRSSWLRAGDHNHLRITRILRSLHVLGEQQAASTLFAALAEIYRSECNGTRDLISERTFNFWKSAIAK
jgi:hypothetical protein